MRVETQATTEFLRKLGARTFDEVLASRGDIWRYGTADFLELRIAGLNEDLRALFELTKLDTLFHISATAEEALAGF